MKGCELEDTFPQTKLKIFKFATDTICISRNICEYKKLEYIADIAS